LPSWTRSAIRRGDHTLNAREHAPDALPQPMANLTDEQRRALRRLARHPDGCAEAELLVDGFTIGQLTDLVIDGLATGTVARTALAGRETPVVWMKITKAGRKAIGE
jgi:hypothetical protein